jgi:predicted ATP-dependent endonuclease of OLD family
MDIKNITFKNYKCFDKVELKDLKPINLIIGKNRIGKSSVLDVVEMIYDIDKFEYATKSGTKIVLEKPLTEKEIKRIFNFHTPGLNPPSLDG